MEIVEPYAKMYDIATMEGRYPHQLQVTKENFGIPMLQAVELIARVSHRSEDSVTKDSWDKFIRSVVLQHGDWSVTEHCVVTVEAYVDRGITHEWVRHRLGAYTQESTRFVNYTKKIGLKFIKPEGLSEIAELEWFDHTRFSEEGYNSLIGLSVTPQIARSVLPNALASKLIVTYNLRMWRHFFLMRTTKEAHPQMRQVTIPLLEQFQSVIPILYEDIIPNARQVDNLRLPR